jgi:hypothetical protein
MDEQEPTSERRVPDPGQASFEGLEYVRVKQATVLARELGIPRRTMALWCKKDPELAYKIGRIYWVRLERFAGRPGVGLIDALTLGSSRWMKAADLARLSEISRKTIGNWCRNRPGFAKRLGSDWYVDLESLGCSEEDIENLVKRLRSSQSGQEVPEEDE